MVASFFKESRNVFLYPKPPEKTHHNHNIIDFVKKTTLKICFQIDGCFPAGKYLMLKPNFKSCGLLKAKYTVAKTWLLYN